MTNRETPHGKMKTLHATFANAHVQNKTPHDEIDLTAAGAGRPPYRFSANFPVGGSEFDCTPQELSLYA